METFLFKWRQLEGISVEAVVQYGTNKKSTGGQKDIRGQKVVQGQNGMGDRRTFFDKHLSKSPFCIT